MHELGVKVILFLIIGSIFLTGCGLKKEKKIDLENYIELDSSSTFSESFTENDLPLLVTDNYKSNNDDIVSIQVLKKNDNNYFYIKNYDKPMSQFSYLYEIVKTDSENKETVIYKSKEKILLINELCITNNDLFFVEYEILNEEKMQYNIVQYDLSTGMFHTIAQYDASLYDEICLEANDNYLLWYTYFRENKIQAINIYHIKTGEIEVIKSSNLVSGSYDRLLASDDIITYLIKNDDTMTANIYNISKKVNKEFEIVNYDPKISYSCQGSDKYIVLFTGFEHDVFYVYEIDTNQLYSINSKGKMNVFSYYFNNNTVYICENRKIIHVVDLATKNIRKINILNDFDGLHFFRNNNNVFLGLTNINYMSLYEIDNQKY